MGYREKCPEGFLNKKYPLMSMNVCVCVCVQLELFYICITWNGGILQPVWNSEMTSKLNWEKQMARMRPWKCKLLRLLQKVLEILGFLRESESILLRFQWTQRSPLTSQVHCYSCYSSTAFVPQQWIPSHHHLLDWWCHALGLYRIITKTTL